MKDDIVTIRNYISNSGIVNTSENPGGNYIGQSITFMAFLLSPIELPPLITQKPKKK